MAVLHVHSSRDDIICDASTDALSIGSFVTLAVAIIYNLPILRRNLATSG